MHLDSPPRAPIAPSTREGWGSRLGFLLAAVGSAVGLGNMWRFPYRTSEGGGAAFVLLYIVMTLMIGLPLITAEFVIGRRSKQSPIGAIVAAGGQRWRPLGYLFVLIGFTILAYYSVITGWTLRYSVESLFTGFPSDTQGHFDAISTGHGALGYHALAMAIAVAVVSGGVKGGIERASMILMPVLFLLLAGLAIWAGGLKGGQAGYQFYLQVDFRELLSLQTLAAAAGQAFFSLSIGMGAMLTYASYLSGGESLPGAAASIATADFLVAFVAGLVVFPMIFAFGLEGQLGESAIGALFIGLPKAFASMGGAGRVVGFMFFSTLAVGALTSGISLLEVVTSSVIDMRAYSRRKAALLTGGVCLLVGVPSAYSGDVLAAMDHLAGNVLLVIGSLALSILVGWRLPDAVSEMASGFHGPRKLLVGWLWTLRILVPFVLFFVLLQTLSNAWSSVHSFF
ncbi:MAG: sodium-dependent transporter [Myxococcales bacterium]|nr:sodium-dependent transporter [Myxococcales bacterium]